MESSQLKQSILEMVKQYAAARFPKKHFTPGESPIPISGKVFDHEEICNIVESALEFHLTTHTFNAINGKQFREFLGVKYALTCNSGSSANLILLHPC